MAENTLEQILDSCPADEVIGDNLIRAWAKINNPEYKKIICTISGGSDSDIVLDICTKCDKYKKIEYVWFDTGLEYQGTKEHLADLENKYAISIKRIKAKKTIPTACKKYGQPFLSKRVSDYIHRLQQHGFEWKDEDFETLLHKYCVWNNKTQKWVGCYTALKWWCNLHESSRFNIEYNKWLKQFLIENPPDFDISFLCCHYAKKAVLHEELIKSEYDLNIYGVRRAEGGTRTSAYKGCFSEHIGGCDEYRPIFWYLDKTKKLYNEFFRIENSKCYTEYGLKRTGCAGCPFGRDFETELLIIQKYEPKLFIAVNNIFGKSYTYTRKYKKFCKLKEEQVAKFVE